MLLCAFAFLVGCQSSASTPTAEPVTNHVTMIAKSIGKGQGSAVFSGEDEILFNRANGPIQRCSVTECTKDVVAGSFSSIAYSSSQRLIATTAERHLAVVEYESGKHRSLKASAETVYGWRGSTILYLQSHGYRNRIMAFNLQDNAETVIFDGEGLNTFINGWGSVSPDGRHLVFGAGHSGILRLHVLDLETGQKRDYTETENYGYNPRWMDNDTIIYGDSGSWFVLNIQNNSIHKATLPNTASALEILAVRNGIFVVDYHVPNEQRQAGVLNAKGLDLP